MPAAAGGPVRTCVGCRRRAPAADLVRVVARGGAVVPDVPRRLTGRGAHLHPDAGCLAQAVRRRAFPRALRVPGPLELAALGALFGPARSAPTVPP